MSALSTLKTYVGYDWKRTDKQTELVQAINDAIVWLASHMPHGNYKFQSWVSTVIGQEDYALPTNVLHVLHPIRLLLGSTTTDSGFPLTKVTKARYDLLEPNPNRTSPSKGLPSTYTIFSRSILLTPIPDKATYLIEINWGKRPTSLSADTDTPSYPTEFDEVIKQGALERLFRMIGLYDEADRWAAMYRDAEGNPVGLARKLFAIERDLEGHAVGQVQSNRL